MISIDTLNTKRSFVTRSHTVPSFCTARTSLSDEGTYGASGGSTKKRHKSSRDAGVRRGKWTPEEEAYATRLIDDFEAGLLPLENGATLRVYLSEKLNCDPMRISKKFTGNKCVGKVK